MERLRFDGPNLRSLLPREGFKYQLFFGGHGGDEYGNCTLYFSCPLFGVTWWYPTGHYQTEVEVPEPGENEWIDRVYYQESNPPYSNT